MNIFWEQIRKAHDFAESLCTEAIEGNSVVLSFPEGAPWREELYLSAEALFRDRSCNYVLVPLEDDGSPLDTLLLENFCRREVRAQYRQNVGAAKFFSAHSESTLHSSYVWVRVSSEARLREWLDFTADYIALIPQGEDKASFIFEAEGLSSIPRHKGIRVLEWKQAIDAYDIYTFCALVSSETGISPLLRPYLVELSSRLCGIDVELARACVEMGEAFLSAPEETLRSLHAFACRSSGEPFRFSLNSEKCTALIWEAQIRCLFAILEKYRSALVSRHKTEIRACLPISTEYGSLLREPNELELGHLVYLAAEQKLRFPQDEYDTLVFLRRCRNELAHMNALPFDDVRRILSLGT